MLFLTSFCSVVSLKDVFSKNKLSTLFHFFSNLTLIAIEIFQKNTSGHFLNLKAFMGTCWIYHFLSCSSFIEFFFKNFLEISPTGCRGYAVNFAKFWEILSRSTWYRDSCHGYNMMILLMWLFGYKLQEETSVRVFWSKRQIDGRLMVTRIESQSWSAVTGNSHLSRKTATYEIGKEFMGAVGGGVEMSGRGAA